MPAQAVFESNDGAIYTTSNGAPVNEPYAAQRAGLHGPLLLQGAYPNRLRSLIYRSDWAQTSTILTSSPISIVSVSRNVL